MPTMLFTLILVLLAVRYYVRQHQRESSVGRGVEKPSRQLLRSCMGLALVPVLYLSWDNDPSLMILNAATVLAFSVFGLLLHRSMRMDNAVGAVTGGAVGANAALMLFAARLYLDPVAMEDEGLGYVGCIVVFSPYATVCGIILGLCMWCIARIVSFAKRAHR